MEAETQVWIRDEEQAWVQATVTDKIVDVEGDADRQVHGKEGEEGHPCTLKLRVDATGAVVEMQWSGDSADVKMQNISDFGEKSVEDLITLTHLHEPAILHALHTRYDLGLIYTYTGPILIAINPFKRLPLYTDSILEEYYSNGLLKSQGLDVPDLAPHVSAYCKHTYIVQTYYDTTLIPTLPPSAVPIAT